MAKYFWCAEQRQDVAITTSRIQITLEKEVQRRA
jgi:hypothetical protein